jgi:hypothetical protein
LLLVDGVFESFFVDFLTLLPVVVKIIVITGRRVGVGCCISGWRHWYLEHFRSAWVEKSKTFPLSIQPIPQPREQFTVAVVAESPVATPL